MNASEWLRSPVTPFYFPVGRLDTFPQNLQRWHGDKSREFPRVILVLMFTNQQRDIACIGSGGSAQVNLLHKCPSHWLENVCVLYAVREYETDRNLCYSKDITYFLAHLASWHCSGECKPVEPYNFIFGHFVIVHVVLTVDYKDGCFGLHVQ